MDSGLALCAPRNDEKEELGSRHATAGLEQFRDFGENADDRLAGDRSLARAGFRHRRRRRAITRFIPRFPGNGNPDQHRGVGKAVGPERNGLALASGGWNRRAIGLGGAVDAGFRNRACGNFAANEVMGKSELDRAEHHGDRERAENSLMNL
jgi:hypothetical protein